MMPQRLITIATALLLVAVSCVNVADKAARETMRTLKPLLLRSEKVDSCLSVLRGMDTTSLSRPADKAGYALLHAMALDKNYIDTTDLSVIEPAVQYYTAWYRPGKADKFYTWYYKGRIEENARKYDAALHSFLEAERVMGGTDDLYRSRLYTSFGRIYIKTLSRQDSYSSFQKALYYAKKTGQMRPYGAALCDCSEGAVYVSHFGEAAEYLKEYEREVLPKSLDTYEYYLRSKVVLYYQSDQIDSLNRYLENYLEVSESPEIWLTAFAYSKLGEYNKAEELLSGYDAQLEGGSSQSYYYAIRSKIQELNGDSDGALEYHRLYDDLISEAYLYNLDRKISSIAYKYHKELKDRTTIIVLSGCFLILLFLLFFFFLLARARERILRRRINEVRVSYDRLFRLLSGRKKMVVETKDSLEDLKNAIISLSMNLKTSTVDSLSASIKAILKVSDAKQTLSLITLFAAVHCSKTFNLLQDKGLDDIETGHCFLLLMGINTSCQANLLNRGSLKNVSLNIRKKLGSGIHNESLMEYLKQMVAKM